MADPKYMKEEQNTLDHLLRELYSQKESIELDISNTELKINDAIQRNNPEAIGDIVNGNRELRNLKNQLKELQEALTNLYTYHLIVHAENGTLSSSQDNMLVGLHGYFHKGQNYIFSWHDPICAYYILGNKKDTFFYENRRQGEERQAYAYNLLLKRKVTIEEEQVKRVFDFHNILSEDKDKIKRLFPLEDELIVNLMKRRSEGQFRNILESIQKEQTRIVLHPFSENLIVQGCAGSGKTMILFHRLPILIYTRQEVEQQSVFVITPSSTYISFLKNLIVDLEITDVRTGTIGQYYLHNLKRYSENYEKILKRLKIHVRQEENPQLENKVYSGPLELDIYRYFYQQLSHCGYRTNEKIESGAFKKIIDQQIEEYQKESLDIKGRIRFYYPQIITYVKYAKEFAYELNNRRSSIWEKSVSYGTDNQDNMLRRLSDDELYFKVLQEQADQLIRILNNLAHLNQEYTTDAAFELIEVYGNFIDLRKYVLKLIHLLERMGDGYEGYVPALSGFIYRLSDMEKCFSGLPTEEDICRLADAVEKEQMYTKLREHLVIDTWNYANGVLKKIDSSYDEDARYVFSAYLLLNIVYQFQGASDDFGDGLIVIDEAQNLSYSEYNLIKCLNPNAVFNLYGDIYQHIEEKRGISDWKELKNLFTYNYYESEYNYRNCSQIVEYCIKRFNVHMKPVNLPGKEVAELTSEIQLRDLIKDWFCQDHSDGLCAVIYKDDDFPNYVRKCVRNIIDVYVVNNNNPVRQDKMNLVHINRAKGMEFRKALVVENGMTEQEKYIACTRAMEELIVYPDGDTENDGNGSVLNVQTGKVGEIEGYDAIVLPFIADGMIPKTAKTDWFGKAGINAPIPPIDMKNMPVADVAFSERYCVNARYEMWTVMPFWNKEWQVRGRIQLRKCYMNILKAAAEKGARTIAIPAFATEVGGYPPKMEIEAALDVVRKFLEENPNVFEKITWITCSKECEELFRELLSLSQYSK